MKKLITILSVFVLMIGSQNLLLAKNTPQEEKNMQIVKLFINEGLNKGNMKLADKIYASNYKHYWNGVIDEERVGPDVAKYLINFVQETYDYYKATIVDIFAKEDKVTVLCTSKGNLKRSGQKVSYSSALIFRFENGKMVEGWIMIDYLGIYKQLGYTLTPPAWAQKKEK
ncbi:MAG: hypothetical protein GTO45_24145 [Candidatus Aminicenantes bacterium]|nr:hypothetical protein [Candidatus Aminicenantes bacterium]NIM81844.1 hypothetical protein [Candidatus Aminicenantes bacterium]NIN21217.1 hypothetical protein [Candidatus Aminicenantes bacterium]NIN45041.1 hypothetical protein [Candidatus Aminicenantes bacterium]NIN87859.1 hypothetical protein [Candidatus Aminicenantes bacterium]